MHGQGITMAITPEKPPRSRPCVAAVAGVLAVLLAVLAVLCGPNLATAAAADFTVKSSGSAAYDINAQLNPGLRLSRGHTYSFDVNAPGHPFWIKTVQDTGTDNSFDTGVGNNGISIGTLTFTVPASAPATLYYQCQFHVPMTGVITIVSPPTVPATTDFTRAILGVGLALLGFAVLGNVRRARARRQLAL
jgi:hypothetical protein